MARKFPKHLLDTERLTIAEISAVLNLAKKYAKQNRNKNKTINKLHGKTLVNLFFEPSTRTRTSFEIAAKRLSADVVNVAVDQSSNKKGETLLDMVMAFNAMQVDAIVIRHSESGVPQFLAPQVDAAIINAGDGTHEHPTQALLDAFTILRHKKTLKNLKIAICGDVQHSRVAHSNIHLLNKFGAKVRIISPPYFMPKDLDKLGVEAFDNMKEGLRDVDVVMTLRIQLERMNEGEFAVSFKEYYQHYGLDHKKLAVAKPNVIVMDPGPINRDVQISSELADDPKFSVVREQIELGVAVRMACLDLLLSEKKN